ncbi:hypothetical protein SAMN05216252_10473 [Actinacidiphila glaucinigra]|uniref:Uncharacterized protein n=1 Tax=Actinacidiphila glaucinigra TaxID=235986 RepID=A0A239CKE9_9ACTN|nr:hypothetical protein SAMN05216252_10473 [Actinacidiphila glaucinigra]
MAGTAHPVPSTACRGEILLRHAVVLREHGGMDREPDAWVTLFSYQNLPGCPRPAELTVR